MNILKAVDLSTRRHSYYAVGLLHISNRTRQKGSWQETAERKRLLLKDRDCTVHWLHTDEVFPCTANH